MKKILIGVFIVTPFFSLAQKKIQTVHIKQSGCKGFCPIFNYTLQSDGTLLYEGEKFTDSIGKYTIFVGKKFSAQIFKKLEKNKFEKETEMFPLKQSDIPMLFYKVDLKNGQTKNIGRANFGPIYLQQIKKQIDDKIKTSKWKKIS